MLLRRRPPGIDSSPANNTTPAFEHLDHKAIAVLRWLNANRVDYVLVGPVAAAIRGASGAEGPVSIVPAPYARNHERLARALTSAHARLRMEGAEEEPDDVPLTFTAEKLARGQQWTLRCGIHDLDIEGRPPDTPSYQELLYETTRFTLAADVIVEVGSPEDIERYAHLRLTGTSPEIRISRPDRVQQDQR